MVLTSALVVPHMALRRRAAPVLLGGGVALVVAGAFLPWVASGAALRNSFEVVQAGRTLGVVEAGLTRAVALAWLFVPAAAAVTWLGLALGWRRAAAVVGTFAGVLGVMMGLAVRSSPLATRLGVDVTIGASVLTFGGAAMTDWRKPEKEIT